MGDSVRLRFAPSPTGYLHIGGVRTALFNWLWARRLGGTFVLRIEDTDEARSTEENTQVILRDMRWLGLNWDEGPEVGGDHGPYFQTQRQDLYQKYVDQLVESGKAYRCYATKEELQKARDELKAKDPKAQFKYPGWWRDKGPADWPKDQPYVIRLKVPESGDVTYEDLVFGQQRFPADAMQDFVLIRSTGMPLYNLGCVIDDHTMGISLVARGRDHMINTPLQVLIYEALGFEVPQFAHLPMMLGKKNEKLSKRHGAVSVAEYRKAGFKPDGLLNYLARFGWSHGDQEVFSLDDLVQKFDWAGCNRSDGRFDPNKLLAINFEHLKEDHLTDEATYLKQWGPYVKDAYGEVDEARLAKVMPLIRPRAKTYLEATERVDWLFAADLVFEEKSKNKFLKPDKAEHLLPLRDLVQGHEPFEAASLEEAVKAWAERDDIKLGAIAQPARVALTGKGASPGLFDVMELLGRETTVARLAAGHALATEG